GIRHNIGSEVQDLLQGPGRHVQQQPHAGRDALEEPDMGHGRGQLDVAHALPAHLGAGDLHAAPVADDAAIADPLVLTAVALPVLRRAEDLLAEEPLTLGLQRAVVDGLRLLDLAAGPCPDLLGGSKSDAYSIEVVYVKARHAPAPLPILVFVVVPEERQRVV